MIYLLALGLLTVAFVQARIFKNPILGVTDHRFPGVIKENGTYYFFAYTSDITDGIFAIHSSTDLSNWQLVGHVFDGSNTPTWAYNTSFNYPEIHKMGNQYVAYFSLRTKTGQVYDIGAAFSSNLLGPYTIIDQPLLAQPWEDSLYPTIINDDGESYLVWAERSYIKTRQLNSNGLSFSSNQSETLLDPILTKDNRFLKSPSYFRRGDYHYIIYTVDRCIMRVARSTNALGPYDKTHGPIFRNNSIYDCMSQGTVVNGLDDRSQVIFFAAYRRNDWHHKFIALLASVSWDAENWPYVEEF